MVYCAHLKASQIFKEALADAAWLSLSPYILSSDRNLFSKRKGEMHGKNDGNRQEPAGLSGFLYRGGYRDDGA